MTLFLVNSGVAGSAKRLQIVQRIVALFSRRRDTHSVDVVNMQIVLRSAPLTSVVVSIKSLLAVAAEAILVLRSLGVFLVLFWITRGPVSNASDASRILAVGAEPLRTCPVSKRRTAFSAVNRVTLCGRTARISLLSPVFLALHKCKIIGAFGTRFLMRSGGLVISAAHNALAFPQSAFCFTMSGERARLASLFIRRGFRGALSAIGASQKSVFGHINSGVASPLYDNERAA